MDLVQRIKTEISISDLLARLDFKINSGGFIYSIYKEEKTPSLKIYLDTNSFYDFSTNEGGDIIKFYADYFNISTSEALKELSDMFGIEKGRNALEQQPTRREKPILPNRNKIQKNLLFNFEIEDFTERAGICEYHGNLQREEAEQIAYDYILKQRREIQTKIFTSFYRYCTAKGIDEQAFLYLTGNKRGLTADTINKFKLFSIISGKESIEFLRDSFSKDELLISGFFSNKYFVFSKHRIVIPYIEKGNITYLRGRYFYKGSSEPERFGKYIGLNNLSGTLSSKRFYNIDLINGLSPLSDLIITEGEFDCMIANQYGNNCIAISGVSNFPLSDIRLIKPFNVYLLFDNDKAGKKATREIKQLFENNNQTAKRLKLKNYKDITELLK